MSPPNISIIFTSPRHLFFKHVALIGRTESIPRVAVKNLPLLLCGLLTATVLPSCAMKPPAAPSKAGVQHPLAKGAQAWPGAAAQELPQGLIWRPQGRPRGTIVCLHGIQTHAAWFGPVARHLTQSGWTVIALDRRGSGVNTTPPFQKGHTGGSKRLLADLDALLILARQETGRGAPLLLLGTSWGANLAGVHSTQASPQAQVDGLILLVPNARLINGSSLASIGAIITGRPPFKDVHYLAGRTQASPPQKPAADGDPPSNSAEAKQGADWLWIQHDRAAGLLQDKPGRGTMKTGSGLQKKWGQKLPASSHPVLLITAERDQIMNNAVAQQQVSTKLANGTAHHVALDAGHAVQLTQPDRLADAINAWAQRLR